MCFEHSTEKKTWLFGKILHRIAVGLTNSIAISLINRIAVTNAGASGEATSTSPATSSELQRDGEDDLEHRRNVISTSGRHLHGLWMNHGDPYLSTWFIHNPSLGALIWNCTIFWRWTLESVFLWWFFFCTLWPIYVHREWMTLTLLVLIV